MESAKLAIPPYVAYLTFRNFLDRFKDSVPGRIDRSVMSNMSGAAQSQVTAALKFLGLVNAEGHPEERLRTLVRSEGTQDRQKAWRDMLEASYPYVLGPGFNFQSATAKQLREQFEKTAATGATLDRCIAFFVAATKVAGIEQSQFLKEGRKPRGSAAPKIKKNSRVDEPQTQTTPSTTSNGLPEIEAKKSLLLWGLLQRLPTPGTVWPKTERDRWTETLNNILVLEYKES
jgi:hypothetical protein